MASSLKCPNPSCPFLFDPSQVPPGAVLTCPRCTMRFTLGPSASKAPPADGLDFTASKPAAKSAKPGAEPEAEPEAKPPFLQSRAMLFIGIAACAAVAAALLALLLSGVKPAPVANPNERLIRNINFALTVPDGWEADDDAKRLAKANVLAIKKAESSARIAIAYTGFNTRPPQPGELLSGLVDERLKEVFDDFESTKSDGVWLDKKGTKITFRGRGRTIEGNFAGEAFAIGVHGNAYWFLAWALESEWEKVTAEIESMRNACRLIDPNLDWKATESGITTFTGEGAEYRVLDGDRWWVKQNDAKDEDPKADLLLLAKFQSKPRSDNPPKAFAVTYILPGSDDPLGTLRGHVKDRFAKLFSIKKWSDVTGDMQGDPPSSGMPANAEVVRYHAENAESPNVSKLVVLNAISTGSGIVGIEAYCPWSDRAKWEKRLVALAASLQK